MAVLAPAAAGRPRKSPLRIAEAAKSVLAARRLSGLDVAGSADNAESRAIAQVAADVFRALPQAEREAMAKGIAEIPGITWLGRRYGPDEYAVSHPGYAHTLAARTPRNRGQRRSGLPNLARESIPKRRFVLPRQTGSDRSPSTSAKDSIGTDVSGSTACLQSPNHQQRPEGKGVWRHCGTSCSRRWASFIRVPLTCDYP